MPALAGFFRQVWDSRSTPESILRAWAEAAVANPVEPGTPPPAFVFLRSGEVIGYLSTIPARFLVAGQTREGYWLKGLWVLPEHRGGPVGFHLVRTAAASLGSVAALAVAEPARRLFEAHGLEDAASPPNYLWPLRGGRIATVLNPADVFGDPESARVRVWKLAQRLKLAGLAGGLAGRMLRVRRGRSLKHRFRVDAEWAALFDDAVDTLWQRMAKPGYQGLQRDAAYLRWRYESTNGDRYVPIAVRPSTPGTEDTLLALAVLKLPTRQESGRFAELNLAWVSDLIFDHENPVSVAAAAAALEAVETAARGLGADFVACSFSGPGYENVLRGLGYLRRPPSMHLLVRGWGETPEADGRYWVVARGDGDSDDAS